jgi:hypothetical protein
MKPNAQTTRRGRPPNYTEDQVAEALRATGGIYSNAARWLVSTYGRKISRSAISERVKSSRRLHAVVANMDAANGDAEEEPSSQLELKKMSESALHHLLATKFRDRGYGRMSEASMKPV